MISQRLSPHRGRYGLIWIVFLAHLGALAFGLIGILYVIPHLADFASNPRAMQVYDWSIRNAGATHILLGALTMFLVGMRAIGLRKTLVFFASSTSISLSSEWLGTTRGIPFGHYAYTNFLGYKIDGHVPYSIPLSWFYIGFASYLLASAIVAALGVRRATAATIALGVWFLTVWDLVLDPAMAHDTLRIKFWEWGQQGAYFGMPIRNFVGWSLTGLVYMSVARLLWRAQPRVEADAMLLPLAVYVANVAFAMVLSASVGLWLPIVLAAVLGVIPAAYVLLVRPSRGGGRPAGLPPRTAWRQSAVAASTVSDMPWRSLRAASRQFAKRKLEIRVEGGEHLPARGPVIVAARHYHHLYDGVALIATSNRPTHVLVTVDWLNQGIGRKALGALCGAARWPAVLRMDPFTTATKPVDPVAARGVVRRAVADSVALLREGRVLIVFPEGYPTVDPNPTPKRADDELLPFQPGFARIARIAERSGVPTVPIVPAGLAYEQEPRWRVTIRYAAPLAATDGIAAAVAAAEQQVRALSGLAG